MIGFPGGQDVAFDAEQADLDFVPRTRGCDDCDSRWFGLPGCYLCGSPGEIQWGRLSDDAPSNPGLDPTLIDPPPAHRPEDQVPHVVRGVE